MRIRTIEIVELRERIRLARDSRRCEAVHELPQVQQSTSTPLPPTQVGLDILPISRVAADPPLHLRDVGLDLPRVGGGDPEQIARQRHHR